MDVDVSAIVGGYARGWFLMAGEDGDLQWYSSRRRAVLPLDGRFHYPKSLQRVLNQKRFATAIDLDFDSVCRGCADRETTWISPELQDIYRSLHAAGWAHSFEAWQDGELAGGVLGIAIGGAFVGETMFYRIPEGSKVALVKLVEHLRSREFVLFDVQMQNPHLERFGAYEIPDLEYQRRLKLAVTLRRRF
ncbi:leucyl/phenylalanyl-tRNA--protein transferase [Rubidibacter lacunae KORDI 51-2]|uniref:Leucyl/phenylalanyl-tRNA--protein transferase n=1 Tax=Rubidibacter lacunae KORDI 51-2 TaxID=582515 RepID=U5DLS5_9CHRO|nr:leucyl/phenylalanyl-tRNA--protein transferase [Rubidibacter lacunae]ERN41534.1 leucyl/phenylalanyl-tRNA--protein transferase [Rubidibacter lacunae KORDI 51-2]